MRERIGARKHSVTIQPPAKPRGAVISPIGAEFTVFCADDKLHVMSLPSGTHVRTIDPDVRALLPSRIQLTDRAFGQAE